MHSKVWITAGAFALALSACANSDADSDSDSDDAYAAVAYAGGDDDAEAVEIGDGDERAPFDEDAAREAAQEELSDSTYEDAGSPYGCTEDCSGHNAGWAYAADGNPDGGISNSNSFDEGQRAFDEAVDDRVEEMRDDYDNGNDPDY